MQTRMQRLGWREPCQGPEFAGSQGRPRRAPKGRLPKGAGVGGVVPLAWGGRTTHLPQTPWVTKLRAGKTIPWLLCCALIGGHCCARAGGRSAISVGTTAQPCQPLLGEAPWVAAGAAGWSWVLLPRVRGAAGCCVGHLRCCWPPVSDITGDAGQSTPRSRGCGAGDSGGASLGRLRPGQC